MKKFTIKQKTKSMTMTTTLNDESLDSIAKYIKKEIEHATYCERTDWTIFEKENRKTLNECELDIKENIYQFSFYRFSNDEEVYMTLHVKKNLEALQGFLKNIVGCLGVHYMNKTKFIIELI